MLINTDKSIADISKETAFQDQAYFCRVFKNVKGIAPSKVRQGYNKS